MKAIAEELETPRESIEFLNLFKKSAERVESLSSSLRSTSIFIGVLAGIAFSVACVSFLSTHVMGSDQHGYMPNEYNYQSSETNGHNVKMSF